MKINERLFLTCPACKRRKMIIDWDKNMNVCPTCGKYLPMKSGNRMKAVFDSGTMHEINRNLKAENPLAFPGYEEKIRDQRKKTGLSESAVTAVGKIGGIETVCVVMDSRFFMGSMSSVVGEKITRAIEFADEKHLPLIIFSASGGARMQEGIFSLIQMVKTADAIEEFSRHGGLYISYLTHPTTGGVTASFATLGDITLAEPGALIGFAGPRVIEQTIGQKLPKGFQRSEYLESHGFVDKVVERRDMRYCLIDLLELHISKGYKRNGISTI